MTEMLTVLLEEKPLSTILARKKWKHTSRTKKNRKRFEEWYKQKYGKDYEWR